jgi:pimeloyl-ACP methyl ester carboxylesterase
MARRIPLVATVLAAAAILVSPLAGQAAPQVADHSCVKGRELWFYAADRTKLVGHRFGVQGHTTVILAHQSNGDLCEWVPYARRLAGLGYFVFPFDFRNHGFSQKRRNFANRLPADVGAALRAVRKLGSKKVFLVGSSMGGIATLMASPSVPPPLAGVISLSAPDHFHALGAVPSVRKLKVPVLYVASEDDRAGEYDFALEARTMYEATAAADKQLELLPGAAHGIALLTGSAAVRGLVEGFLSSH